MTHYRHFASLPIEIEELDYALEPSVFLLEPIQDAPGFAFRYQWPTNSFGIDKLRSSPALLHTHDIIGIHRCSTLNLPPSCPVPSRHRRLLGCPGVHSFSPTIN